MWQHSGAFTHPFNTCIADYGSLTCSTDRLAFSGEFPVLPNDTSGLADMINCCEIESCHKFPGFVRLRDSGELKYNWKHKKYTFNRNIHQSDYLYKYVNNISEARLSFGNNVLAKRMNVACKVLFVVQHLNLQQKDLSLRLK